jgi:hypothetical protein
MRLVMTDGRNLRLKGYCNPRPMNERLTILGKTFEGDSGIDVARMVIEANIAKRRGQSDWPPSTSEGLPDALALRQRPVKN